MGFFVESSEDFVPTKTLGTFTMANAPASFERIFEEACDNFKQKWKTEFRQGFVKADILNNPTIVANFKNDLLGKLQEDCANMQTMFEDGDAGVAPKMYETVAGLFDNKVEEYITESANVGDLLPIKTVDFPLLVKSHVKESFNQVVGTEVTPSLIVKKRIEHTIIYDRKNPKKTWEYPQCLYDPEFQEIVAAGEGIDLSTEPQELPLYQFDLVDKLTDVSTTIGRRVVLDLCINQVVTADDIVVTLQTPIQVNLADGAWVGGKIDLTYTIPAKEGDATATPPVPATPESTGQLEDILSGFVDWNTNTVTLTSANTEGNGVKAVIFSGKLSNERNENTIRTRYVQEDKEWKIGEGCKIDASYTLEELQEHKALADMDLYQRSYNDLVMLLSAISDKRGYLWLDDMYAKYKGVELNPLDWNPVVLDTFFDCDSSTKTVALPSEYLAKELKFKIDTFLVDIADTVKLENLHFVMYGNPRFIRLVNPFVKWVFNAGQSVGGVKLDHSYGVMTSGDVKIYVVSSKLIDARTHKGLRFIPFFDTGITFKRMKFRTDIITSKESAYKDPDHTAGSMTYVWGVERYKDIALQAIQGNVEFRNADFIEML